MPFYCYDIFVQTFIYLFFLLSLRVCGGAWLNKNNAKKYADKAALTKKHRNKMNEKKEQQQKAQHKFNLFALQPEQVCQMGDACVCVWDCDIVLPRHLQAAQSQSQAACGRGCCCR